MTISYCNRGGIGFAGFLLLSCAGVQSSSAVRATHQRSPVSSRVCAIQGTWRLEDLIVNGQPAPFGSPHLKIVNETHFAVVEELSDSIRSASDSTKNVARPGSLTLGFAGRYSVDGDDYVEHVEVIAFNPSQLVGHDLHAKCEVKDNIWYHRFTVPGTMTRIEERYRRVSP